MEPTLFKIIGAISTFSVVVPIIFYLRRLSVLPRQNHIIGLLVIISVLFDVFNYSLFANKEPNFLSSNIYNLILFLLLSRYFYELLFKMAYRKIFYAGTFCFILLALFTSFFLQNIQSEYQSVVWVAEALILCIYASVYHVFVSTGSTHVIFNPHLHSELSIVGGIFVYFSFSFAFFILMNYIMSELDSNSSRLLWSVHNGNNIIKNIFFAFGLYYTGKRKITITEKEYDLAVARERKSFSNNPLLN